VTRRIALVSVGRSDYGLYRPLLQALRADPRLEPQLFAGATHLVPRFGDSLAEIEADDLAPVFLADCTLATDRPGSLVRSMALATLEFGRLYESQRPDLVVVLGDRYETHAAAVASVPLQLPLAHIGGGAITRGAFDDSLRHAVSKLAHLHFPETEHQAERLRRMGEAGWRVHAVGSLSLDAIAAVAPLDLAAFNRRFGTALPSPPLLVTYHPVTREWERTGDRVEELLAALDGQPHPLLFTSPNADTHGSVVAGRIRAFVAARPGRAFLVPSLGSEGYYSALAFGLAMVGNSSSGIIEASSFRLPVVDLGRRQEGREAPANVLHCAEERSAIAATLARALSPAFRAGLEGLVNPYGAGGTAARIAEVLASVPLDERLLFKEAF